ncbi:MAG TPA: hypothetical protein VEJ63_17055, partial [Planctomycetota bacterium]|nr:hypothetical protein [Planctomycetota bacterium]
TTQPHAKGSLVYDGRARLISDYKFKNTGVVFSPFRSVMEIKAGISASGASMAPDEFARIERYLTIFSGMNSPYWGHAARPSEQSFSSGLRGFNVEKGEGFTPGGLIRVVQNGTPLKCGRIRAVGLKPDGSAFIALEDDIGISASGSGVGNDIYIQPELKHPINLNTASPQVIEAVVMGVCLDATTNPVTREVAQGVAALLTKHGSVFTSHEDLRKELEKAQNTGLPNGATLLPAQRDAIFINASEPNSPKLRTSTVPFCYHSFGTYTIEGSGVSNADNGMQLARHTVRQLVSLPTPWPGRFKVQYQAGFQGLIDQGLASRVVTFPVPMGKYKLRRNAPNTQLPAQNYGDVRLDVGESGPHGLPGEWIDHCDTITDPGYRQDGYDLAKRGKAFVHPPSSQRRNANSVATQPGSVEMWVKSYDAQQMVFFEEGIDEERNRVTFSYEPGEGLVVRLFDAGLECQDSAAKDFKHLKRKPVEFIYPIRLEAHEWYHIAGSWKTGTVNGQDIRVDAQPNPTANEQIKMKPGTKLSSDVKIDEVDKIDVEEADKDDFPLTGAIRIGEEIIEYAARRGNSFTGLTRGARLSAMAEHKEGELVLPYGYSSPLADDLAVGGGRLVERIEKASDTHTRVNLPVPPNKVPYILDSEVKKLPVLDATMFPPSGFIVVGGELMYYGKKTAQTFEQLQRAQGSAGVSAPARNIRDGAHVALASIQVDKIADYDARGIVQIDDESNDKLVEWIYHADKQTIDGKHYLVAELHSSGMIRNSIEVGEPPTRKDANHVGINRFRGQFGIRPNTAHAKKAKVIPVVRMQGPHCGNQSSPYGDDGVSTVSVVSYGQTDGDLRYVKQAYIHQYPVWHYTGPNNTCPARFDHWAFDFYVGLNDFVSRRFNRGNSRLLKWPSGELPDAVGSQRYVCQDRNQGGMIRGIVDELKLNTHPSIGGRIAMTTGGAGLTAGDEEILIEEFDAWPENRSGWNANLNWGTTGGLVRINDELIFYRSASQHQIDYYADVHPALNNQVKDFPNKADRSWRNPCPPPNGTTEHRPNIHRKTVMRLSNVKRGVLGTQAADHSVGAYAMLLDGMAVSALSGQLSSRADSFSVLNGAGFPEEGYAWVGDGAYGGEVVSWQNGGGTTFSGCKNFHGRFGTGTADHVPGTIVRCLPFRYWDREARNYDGTGLAYIQTGYAAPDAIWDSIELSTKGTENLPEPAGVQPRLLVRFDGTPNWDVDPSNQEGGLYEFRGKRGVIPIAGGGGSGRGVRADQIDIRLYWEFRPGCFMPRSSDWKRTFAVEKLRATYSSPLIMRRLDVIEKR